MSTKGITPLLWFLFGAGGMVSALFFPVHIFLVGLAFPLGWFEAPSYEALHNLVLHPITRLYLFVFIFLPLFHWAHRFRYAVADLGIKLPSPILAILCYGAAILGALLAVFFLTS